VQLKWKFPQTEIGLGTLRAKQEGEDELYVGKERLCGQPKSGTGMAQKSLV